VIVAGRIRFVNIYHNYKKYTNLKKYKKKDGRKAILKVG